LAGDDPATGEAEFGGVEIVGKDLGAEVAFGLNATELGHGTVQDAMVAARDRSMESLMGPNMQSSIGSCVVSPGVAVLIKMDRSNRKGLDAVFERYRIGAVIHFAAFAYVGESMQVPADYFRNNVVNSLSLLDAMLNNGIRRIVKGLSLPAPFGA